MFKFLRNGKSSGRDEPGTPVAPLVDRIEALEHTVRRTQDELRELEDGITRRFDKYRKRLDREEREEEPAVVDAAPPPSKMGRVLPFDEIAVRRSGRSFPGRKP